MRFLRRKLRGFTLIELLTVIVIIVILSAMVLSLYTYVAKKQGTARAQAEIQAMSAAAESYKADNGVYPDDGTYSSSGTYVPGAAASLYPTSMGNPTPNTSGTSPYFGASQVLYKALSGDVTLSGSVVTSGSAAVTVYMSFKPSQLLIASPNLPISSSNHVLAIADPFGYSYGYSTAMALTRTNGYNPTYDLWSTVTGTSNPITTGTDTVTAKWLTNW